MRALWIADFTTADHIGGAELTGAAIIEAAEDTEVVQIKTAMVNQHIAADDSFDVTIVDSMTQMSRPQDVRVILDKRPFFSIEFDYNKVSPTRHLLTPQDPFLKNEGDWGKWYREFWAHPNRKRSFFMSEEQRKIHREKIVETGGDGGRFDETTEVLSSIFSQDFWAFVDKLQSRPSRRPREDYLIFDTQHPLKGKEQSVAFAEANKLTPVRLFSKLSPKQLLREMSKSKGLVFLPTMHDSCPRMAIEALILGCEIHINDLVQMKDEEWFQTPEAAREYLEHRGTYFWDTIKQHI